MVLSGITKWFTGLGRRPSVCRVPTTRLRVESLERREVPALLGGLAVSLPTPPAALVAQTAPQAATLNQQIVAFCQSHRGSRVGGGECAHLAMEALRVAGADFTAHDPNHNGDYVWGTLVTTITRGRDTSSARCQPGDIIQFQNVTLSGGWTAGQHTAIVAAVDSLGRPTQVYEQNVGVDGKGKGSGAHDRTDRLDPVAINMHTITSGTVHIYRAVPRVTHAGSYNFSLVNNTSAAVTVQLRFGTNNVGSPFMLSKANTPQVNGALPSYVTETASWWGGPATSLNVVVNGKPLTLVGGGSIQDGGGYEIAAVGGQLVLRRV
jgi:hypothetical protein